jgi:hypothetical protein
MQISHNVRVTFQQKTLYLVTEVVKVIQGLKLEFRIKYVCDNGIHFLVPNNHKGWHVEIDVRADLN